MTRHLFAGALCAALLAACGAAAPHLEATADAATDAADAATDAADAAADALQDGAGRLSGGVADTIDHRPLAQRRAHCRAEGGAWVDRLEVGACEDGVATLDLDGHRAEQRCRSGTGATFEGACVHYDGDGGIRFDDGPSVPHVLQALGEQLGDDADIGRWNDIFWQPAINHDNCYHHNGATYGLTQAACDQQLFSDLSAICCERGFAAYTWFSQERCRTRAAVFYASVRAAGASAFAAVDTEVAYPAWEPLWQQYGMDHDVSDAALAARIEELLGDGA